MKSKSTSDRRPGKIRNLGPKSSDWLAGVGVHTTGQLAERGVLSVYVQLKAEGYPATLNLLWAMHAAVTDRDWREVTREEKDELLEALPEF